MNLTKKQKIGVGVGVGVGVVVLAIVLYFVFKSKNAPKTTEAPPKTTEAPPKTTEAPPKTTEAPPKTTEAPPKTTETPPKTTESPVVVPPTTKNTDPVIIKTRNGQQITITDKDALIRDKSIGQKQTGCRLVSSEQNSDFRWKISANHMNFDQMVKSITLPSDIKCTTYIVLYKRVVGDGNHEDACKQLDEGDQGKRVIKADVIPAGSKDFLVSQSVNAFLFEAA